MATVGGKQPPFRTAQAQRTVRPREMAANCGKFVRALGTLPQASGDHASGLVAHGSPLHRATRSKGIVIVAIVLCNNGCWRQRQTQILAQHNFSAPPPPPPPPQICTQNDQRHLGIILSRRCLGSPPPPLGTAGRAPPALKPSPADKEGGGVGNGPPPPPQPRGAIFVSPCTFGPLRGIFGGLFAFGGGLWAVRPKTRCTAHWKHRSLSETLASNGT